MQDETAGTFDLEAELKIWISSESNPSIQKKFNKGVNVYDVQKVLAKYVLHQIKFIMSYK
jgi:hypothetical protein